MNLDSVDSSTLLHISWANINSGTKAVAHHILNNRTPDVMIALQEDIIPSALVCNIINTPLCIAHLKKRQNGVLVDCMPKINAPIRSGVYNQSPQPSIGILSTLIDNDHNIDDLIRYYTVAGHNITTFCIYSRKKVNNPPDYNWVKLAPTTKCVFPWQE